MSSQLSHRIEHLVFQAPRGVASRVRLFLYRIFGMRTGHRNRMEGGGRVRHCSQISLGSLNAFTQGCWLWPTRSNANDTELRIKIGSRNYFNRNLMIDACGMVQIGDDNLFGPDVYITDSNHAFGPGIVPKNSPMKSGQVIIGNRCWIGAGVAILSGVQIEDDCVVGAGSVVTKSIRAGGVVAGVPARAISSSKDNV